VRKNKAASQSGAALRLPPLYAANGRSRLAGASTWRHRTDTRVCATGGEKSIFAVSFSPSLSILQPVEGSRSNDNREVWVHLSRGLSRRRRRRRRRLILAKTMADRGIGIHWHVIAGFRGGFGIAARIFIDT